VMSDRIIVMSEGKIIQDRTPADLYDRPATPYVANFVGSSNLLSGEVREIQAGVLVGQVGEQQIRAAHNGLAVEVGAPITICIRPAKIHVLASGGSAPEGFSTMSGVVDEHFFHGSAVRMAVTLDAGVTCMVDLRLDSALGQSSLPEAGSSITLVVDPANVIVFAAARTA